MLKKIALVCCYFSSMLISMESCVIEKLLSSPSPEELYQQAELLKKNSESEKDDLSKKGLYGQAVGLYKESAKLGYKIAQEALGDHYINLKKTSDRTDVQERLFEKAIKWYEMAANQNNASAQYKLAIVFQNKKRATKNEQIKRVYQHESLQWAKKGADNNHQPSMTLLTKLLEKANKLLDLNRDDIYKSRTLLPSNSSLEVTELNTAIPSAMQANGSRKKISHSCSLDTGFEIIDESLPVHEGSIG